MEGRYEEVSEGSVQVIAEQNQPESSQRQWPVMSIHTCEYILMAPTSPAIPIHDEPVTFLNQNHSYEIRFRTSFPAEGVHHMLKTVITLCFESRKIRIQPQKYLEDWRKRNSGKRFLVLESAGEKGQPFRLVFQTFSLEDGALLHQSSAQIQIFKLRGAERKRQTEREKAAKLGNQEQFQPAYDYTILLDTSFGYEVEDDLRSESLDVSDSVAVFPEALQDVASSSHSCLLHSQDCGNDPTVALSERIDSDGPPSLKRIRSGTEPNMELSNSSREPSLETLESSKKLLTSFSPAVTVEWLRRNRFQKYAHLFADFNGEDLLRLSLPELSSLMKSDAQAVRLYHAMRQKVIEPLCTIYLAVDDEEEYSMIILVDGTVNELKSRVSALAQRAIEKFQVNGPSNICVTITDEVIQSWPRISIFRVTFDSEKCLLVDDRLCSNIAQTSFLA